MVQAYGLYTHIQANRRRSIALLIGLFLLVYVMVFAGALLAEALGGDGSLDRLVRLAWWDFLKALPWATIGAGLWNLLENLCISRGITMPKLKVMDSRALNAFASGLNPKQYSITVTSGLLE